MHKIIVVGAGPAGIMAALSASRSGAEVLLIERNKTIGKKLSLTGGGRCNLTSSLPIEDFFQKVVTNPSFLYSSFYTFDNEALMGLFKEKGVPLKQEGLKIYPASERADKIVSFFEKELEDSKVHVLLNEKVLDILVDEASNRVVGIRTNRQSVRADKLIVATGGASYPATGSDGEMFSVLKKKGIQVTELFPALVQLFSEEDVSVLSGISVPGVRIGVTAGRMKASITGDLLFTQRGISGPAVLNISSYITKLPPGDVRLHIDFLPHHTNSDLSNLLFSSKKQLSTLLSEVLPLRLSRYLMEEFDRRDKFNLSKQERVEVIRRIKEFITIPSGYGSLKESIVTQGGVDVAGVSSSTMESKRIKNLYFAGECLDLDAMTGGYNLQIAFSTGYLAGLCAAQD